MDAPFLPSPRTNSSWKFLLQTGAAHNQVKRSTLSNSAVDENVHPSFCSPSRLAHLIKGFFSRPSLRSRCVTLKRRRSPADRLVHNLNTSPGP